MVEVPGIEPSAQAPRACRRSSTYTSKVWPPSYPVRRLLAISKGRDSNPDLRMSCPVSQGVQGLKLISVELGLQNPTKLSPFRVSTSYLDVCYVRLYHTKLGAQ